MRVGEGAATYEWIGDWADITGGGHDPGWAHHDVAVASDGRVIAFHHSEGFLVFGPNGTLVTTVPTDIRESHGLCLVHEDGRDVLWAADIGFTIEADEDCKPKFSGGPQQVVKLGLDGEVLLRLGRPDIPAYADRARWVPTGVTADPETGWVWVGDGYGSSWIHRYDGAGTLVQSLRGDEPGGPGALDCPHAVMVDRRSGVPLLYVADRGNQRIVVYSIEGEFLRTIDGVCNSPSSLTTFGPYLIVAELNARVVVCDADDQLVAYVGENTAVVTTPGWPNSTDSEGRILRQTLLEPGKFNSPHGIATDAAGNVYVSEWLLGGRFTKLQPVT